MISYHLMRGLREFIVIKCAIMSTLMDSTSLLVIFLLSDENVLYFLCAASSENVSSGFPTRSDTNWSVQPREIARGLKFRI